MAERVRRTVKVPERSAERLLAYCGRNGLQADELTEQLVSDFLAEHGFKIGDKVNYHAIIGGPVTTPDTEILDGPYDQCGTVTWKVRGVSGTVAEVALSPLAKVPLD